MVDIECTWDDTDSGRRRREFCNKYEGYGSICSCQDPAPLDIAPKPVSVMSVIIYTVVYLVVRSNMTSNIW